MTDRHPSWEEILDHLDAGEPADSPEHRHVSACASCSRLAEEIRRILAGMRAARLCEPPRESVERAIAAVMRELAAQPRGLARVLSGPLAAAGEIWARLVGDSLAAGAAVRGAAGSRPRMLLYETDDFAITLSLAHVAPAGMDVIGQVTPRGSAALPSGGRAVLTHAGRSEETPLSPFGEFVFENERAEVDDLSILLAGSRIRLSLPEISAS